MVVAEDVPSVDDEDGVVWVAGVCLCVVDQSGYFVDDPFDALFVFFACDSCDVGQAVEVVEPAADDTPAPERWRPDEVRPATAVGSLDDLDAIGARIEAMHHGGGVVTSDNRHDRGDTPGLPGFDY